MVIVANDAQDTSRNGGAAIAAWFPLHQNEFDVVLDYRIRFVGLAKERRAIAFDLIGRVCDFVPNDGSKVVVSNGPAVLLNRSVKRNHGVPGKILKPGLAGRS